MQLGLCIFKHYTEVGWHPTYFLDRVSQCHPHAGALLWALLCVCGASVVHSHPHDRLRESIWIVSWPFPSLPHRVVSVLKPPNILTELTAIVLDVVHGDVGGYKWCAVVFFLVPLFGQQLGFRVFCLDNVFYLCTGKEIKDTTGYP